MLFQNCAAEFCLKSQNLNWTDLDCIAFGWNPAINLAEKYRGNFSDRARFPGDWFFSLANQFLPKMNASTIGSTIHEFRIDDKVIKVHFVNHHDAHAANAFLMSPFDSAAVFTADHYGEKASTVWQTASYHSLLNIKEIDFPDSIGAFYAAFTELLGYRPHKDEWKIMGLSAYGDYKKHLRKFDKIVSKLPGGDFALDLSYFNHYSFETRGMYSKKLVELFGGTKKPSEPVSRNSADIAAGLQHVTEEIIFHCLEALYEKTHNSNLCLAGGCIMNSVLNGKLRSRLPFDKIYIPFAPDDTGNSIGAALYANWAELKDKHCFTFPEGPYLGPAWSDDDIEGILKKYKHAYYKVDNPAREAARLLFGNNIIGWFQGRMEFGARALGNRCIIGDPRQRDMKKRINVAVKYRESFRPFAPAILAEKVNDYFVIPDDLEEVPFMEKVYMMKNDKRDNIPAVVHEDGSGRLQTVRRETNPVFYELIQEFEKLTNVPVVLNTSFNRKGEPIVCSPDDALKTFSTCGLDFLIMNKFVIPK